MDELWINNNVELCGSVVGAPVFSHINRGEGYYTFPLETSRLSGTADTVNVLARQTLMSALELSDKIRLGVSGELRSFNNKSGIGNKLILNVFANRLYFTDSPDCNLVRLTGTLCKLPNYRSTPLGRDICDLMLAVSRKYGRADYLPCIVWGRDAIYASTWNVGDRVRLSGRLQSRRYIKINLGERILKTAYEVSVSAITRI